MKLRGNHVDELISASLSGDLTDAERIELESHLARCETCRSTLVAFTAERRILSGLPVADPPRDLGARVRTGIESGRLAPWWRRPGGLIAIGASLATVAAAVLAVVVFNNLDLGPVGHQSASPNPSVSVGPSTSANPSVAPSVEPSVPPTFLGAGELGYLSLNGAAFEALRLTFINDATGASIDAGSVSGPPIASALSPNGQWLAYITQKGETGANEAWALHLSDGEVVPLGCSFATPFTDRLAWSDNSLWLGYTLASVDLGEDAGCPPNDGGVGTTDPWIFDTTRNYAPSRVTRLAPDAFAAGFFPGDGINLAESQAGTIQSTTVTCWFCDGSASQTIDGVFIPILSPDGNRALFWTGVMAPGSGGWQFSLGGMPHLSGDFRSAGPASPWIGTPLFADLTPVSGEAFAYGDFAWGPDSDLIAFWNGTWTGAPQSADGSYPTEMAVYVGRISGGLLTKASRLPLTLPPNGRIVDVTFSADGGAVAVTIGLPSAGVGDPPSAFLQIVPLDGGSPHAVGGGAEAPPWNGPAVYGY